MAPLALIYLLLVRNESSILLTGFKFPDAYAGFAFCRIVSSLSLSVSRYCCATLRLFLSLHLCRGAFLWLCPLPFLPGPAAADPAPSQCHAGLAAGLASLPLCCLASHPGDSR